MVAYAVASYTITNADGYQEYGRAVGPILAAHRVEILAADNQTHFVEGEPGQTTVILRFPSKEAALNFYESPEYKAIAHHRTDNSVGTIVICDELVIPGR